MKTARIIAVVSLIVGSGVALHAATQQMAFRRKDLLRNDLSASGREVVQARVEIDPGFISPRHWHPGEEVVYVLEGTLEYQLEGQPPVTLKPGDVLFVPARTVHAAKNVGTGPGAELATYILEKGQTPLVVVK